MINDIITFPRRPPHTCHTDAVLISKWSKLRVAVPDRYPNDKSVFLFQPTPSENRSWLLLARVSTGDTVKTISKRVIPRDSAHCNDSDD